jgi:hypothetical protein
MRAVSGKNLITVIMSVVPGPRIVDDLIFAKREALGRCAGVAAAFAFGIVACCRAAAKEGRDTMHLDRYRQRSITAGA